MQSNQTGASQGVSCASPGAERNSLASVGRGRLLDHRHNRRGCPASLLGRSAASAPGAFSRRLAAAVPGRAHPGDLRGGGGVAQRAPSMKAASWLLETAPTLVASGLPPLNRISVGMPRTLYLAGLSLLASTSTLQTLTLPA